MLTDRDAVGGPSGMPEPAATPIVGAPLDVELVKRLRIGCFESQRGTRVVSEGTGKIQRRDSSVHENGQMLDKILRWSRSCLRAIQFEGRTTAMSQVHPSARGLLDHQS